MMSEKQPYPIPNSISDCLNILRDIREASLATVAADKSPQIRIVDIMIHEDEKLYLYIPRGKEMHAELTANPRIALLGYSGVYQSVRLQGTVKPVDHEVNDHWVDKVFAENESLNAIYPAERRYVGTVFVIEDAVVEFFDLTDHPITRRLFTMGDIETQIHQYHVGDRCIGCGICAYKCPSSCITLDKKRAMIDQEHCLHCGICSTVCPSHAISLASTCSSSLAGRDSWE